MKILHSEETQVLAPSEEEGATGLAGAVRFEDADRPGTVFYKAFSLSELDRYLGSDEEYILADYEEDVTATLERRYPCADVTCSRVLRETVWRYREHSPNSWPQWSEHYVSGWAVFDKPVNTSDEPEDWAYSSRIAGGPIFVCEEMCDTTLDSLGLTCSVWHNEMWRVNHNPRAIELRPHRAALKEYKRRMRGHAPSDDMNSLMRMVTQFGNDSPLNGVAETLETTWARGWGHRAQKEFSEEEILNAATVMAKLGRKFWRGKGSYNNPFEEVAEYVHGIEAYVAERREKNHQGRMKSYLKYLLKIRDPEYRAKCFLRQKKKRPIKFRQWDRAWVTEKAWRLRLQFCQWIRSEMRAIGEKMPAKPVKPTLKKKKRRKKKRSSRGGSTTRKRPRKASARSRR